MTITASRGEATPERKRGDHPVRHFPRPGATRLLSPDTGTKRDPDDYLPQSIQMFVINDIRKRLPDISIHMYYLIYHPNI